MAADGLTGCRPWGRGHLPLYDGDAPGPGFVPGPGPASGRAAAPAEPCVCGAANCLQSLVSEPAVLADSGSA